jgi:hypothetical protein
LSNGHAKTSTIAIIEQATPSAKQADPHHSRQSADQAMPPPTKPPAAQETVHDPRRAHVTTMAIERKATYPPRPPATGRRRSPGKEAGWSVAFQIDSALPVTDTEVQVLETWLGRQVDTLFEGTHSSRNDIAVSDEAMKSPMRKRGQCSMTTKDGDTSTRRKQNPSEL